MIHREAWYREILGYLGEQDTQGLDEDTWSRPKAPGHFPLYEEKHPRVYPEGKEGGEYRGESGSEGESYPSLQDLYDTDPEALSRILELAYSNPDLFTQRRDPSDMFGLTVSPMVSLWIRRYVTDQPVEQSVDRILRAVEKGNFSR